MSLFIRLVTPVPVRLTRKNVINCLKKSFRAAIWAAKRPVVSGMFVGRTLCCGNNEGNCRINRRDDPVQSYRQASPRRASMLKVVGWIVFIIFLIGLLVVLGFFKLIF